MDNLSSNDSVRYISPTTLAFYVVKRNRCERFLRFSLCKSEYQSLEKRYGASLFQLTPLLSEEGEIFEQKIEEELDAIYLTGVSTNNFIDILRNSEIGTNTYFQVPLDGKIGNFSFSGKVDFIEIKRSDNDFIDAVVIDAKASRRESVQFRLQIASYSILLRDILNKAGLQLNSIKGRVLYKPDNASEYEASDFDLDIYEDEVTRLIKYDAENVLKKSFDEVDYHLSYVCDDCRFNQLCFIDTAERYDLSLVPNLTHIEKKTLKKNGVNTAAELATLMSYNGKQMVSPTENNSEVERLSSEWPLSNSLPLLVQRAKAAMYQYDKEVDRKTYLLPGVYGTLPDDIKYPDLIKIFIDAQRDYIQDRLYMISTVIVSPNGNKVEIIEMTDAPPNTESERDLIVRWLTQVLKSIPENINTTEAALHLYLYQKRDQQVLLDALTRHFTELCAIPAFYDLLSSSAAISQDMISFLFEEIMLRKNLPAICSNLYITAAALGFKWKEDDLDFMKKFRANAFGNKKVFVRSNQTGLFRKTTEADKDNKLYVEANSRFKVQIPLEYAYVAWDAFNESVLKNEKYQGELTPYLGTTVNEIKRLGIHRVHALVHIEKQFDYKNRYVEKTKLNLTKLNQVEIEPDAVPFNRTLEDFLYLEQYSKRQQSLMELSLSAEQRVNNRTALMLKCLSISKINKDTNATFEIITNDLDDIDFDEGSFVVLNPLEDVEGKEVIGSRLIYGSIGIIKKLEKNILELTLTGISSKSSRFMYKHWGFKPAKDQLCTIDEMVDDLNADKYLDALQNAEFNNLYQWANAAYVNRATPPPVRTHIRPAQMREAGEFAKLAAQAQSPHGLTDAQIRIIGDYLKENVLVIQGPPGTGKSHTLGYACLSRAIALKPVTRPFRIAVMARTHAAIEIVLKSIVNRREEILKVFSGHKLLKPLDDLFIAKIVSESGEHIGDGINTYTSNEASDQRAILMTKPILILGGTPGSLHKFMKKVCEKSKKADWSEKYFDLVIVDEASQMGIAEAITAAESLKYDGQFIVVGDHRQMTPILSHTWDRESRRDLMRARPHLSIFEYLIDLGFERTALDQSFRIPTEIADFLNRHIYSPKDGINYFSKQRKRLTKIKGAEDWVKHALDPQYPMILIEHHENSSMKSNRYEAGLIESIVNVIHKSESKEKPDIGIVVPHKLQKALLQKRLPAYADSIDTVERFQGDERELIIVSATESDKNFIQAMTNFILNPNRFTVSISRPKQKLIVIASQTIFDLIPTDLDDYENGSLWKYLRLESSKNILWNGKIDGHNVNIFGDL